MSAYIQAVNQSKLLTARSLGLTVAECYALSDSYRERKPRMSRGHNMILNLNQPQNASGSTETATYLERHTEAMRVYRVSLTALVARLRGESETREAEIEADKAWCRLDAARRAGRSTLEQGW